VAKLHATIADKRLDFLHQLSTRIIRENQTMVLEDLNVLGMLKSKNLSRSIADAGWRQFRTLLEAKALQYGRQLVVINRWLPTSQVCSARRTPRRQTRAVDSGMAVPELRSCSRPRHQRCFEHPRRRTGGESKRAWSRA
jgi:putative transposase